MPDSPSIKFPGPRDPEPEKRRRRPRAETLEPRDRWAREVMTATRDLRLELDTLSHRVLVAEANAELLRRRVVELEGRGPTQEPQAASSGDDPGECPPGAS